MLSSLLPSMAIDRGGCSQGSGKCVSSPHSWIHTLGYSPAVHVHIRPNILKDAIPYNYSTGGTCRVHPPKLLPFCILGMENMNRQGFDRHYTLDA